MRLFLAIFFISVYSLSAQDEKDSIIDFENLDYDKLKEKLTSKIVIKKSSGWLPYPVDNFYEIGFYMDSPFSSYELAENISSSNFFLKENRLSGDIDLDREIKDKYRWEKEKFSEILDEGFPESSYGNYGINFNLSAGLPFIIGGKLGIAYSDALLYSLDKSKKFLNFENKLIPFKEMNIFYLDDWSFSFAAQIEQPIYGIFANSNGVSIFSYYYLKLAYSVDIPFYNKVKQYLQNANKKNELRYENGTDRKYLINKKYDNLKFNRNSILIALGWKGGNLGTVSFGFELQARFLQTSLLDDANWKQFHFGININLNYINFIYK